MKTWMKLDEAAQHLGISSTALRELHAWWLAEGHEPIAADVRSSPAARHAWRFPSTRIDAWFVAATSARTGPKSSTKRAPTPKRAPAELAKAHKRLLRARVADVIRG